MHHPHNSLYIKLKLSSMLNCRFFLINKKGYVGLNNYFIDTTLWSEINFPVQSKVFIVNSNFKEIKTFNNVNIEKLKKMGFFLFLKKLTFWVSS